jgi:hypothetical protein
MDEIDYKKVAENVVMLIENNFDMREIKSYLGWVQGKKIFCHTGFNYKTLCDVLKFLELPMPSEEEWKKR